MKRSHGCTSGRNRIDIQNYRPPCKVERRDDVHYCHHTGAPEDPENTSALEDHPENVSREGGIDGLLERITTRCFKAHGRKKTVKLGHVKREKCVGG
jgi:hypothetical protein